MPRKFLQQRLFYTLRIGIRTGVTHNNHDSSVHCRQSDLDSACGLHCAAMALSLLGLVTHPGSLPKRQKGIAAKLWQASQGSYFNGLDASCLADVLGSLGAKLRINYFEGSHRKTLAFTNDQLESGGLVIASWQTRNRQTHHWVLVVGIEGVQYGSTFTPSALLIMDPGNTEPRLCGYNARLQLTSNPIRQVPSFVTYVTIDGTTLPVTLTSAVGIHKQ